MRDNSEKNINLDLSDSKKSAFSERRRRKRERDPFFRVVVILNVSAWLSLLIALFLFHYARPEFITGVQKYWGIEGRNHWSKDHVDSLLVMLQVCLGFAFVSTLMRSRRNRRRRDNFGVNLFILIAITSISLATLYTSVT